MGDKTDDKNESSHEMKDNDDDPSHMGDDNHQHDEHDDKDAGSAGKLGTTGSK